MYTTPRIAGLLALCLLSTAASADGWRPTVLLFAMPVTPEVQISPSVITWDARIDYDINADAIELAKKFAQGDERGWSKAVFATLQRRFPGDGVTPYVGLGAGFAKGLVATTESEVIEDALAFKGVFGSEFTLKQGFGAFVEYSFAVSPNAETGSDGSLRSHALSTGLKLDLN